MEITKTVFRMLLPPETPGPMRAVVSVTFDDEIVVHDIKIIQSADKLFMAFPSKKTSEGRHRDIIHTITQAARNKFEPEILARYRLELAFQESFPDEQA